MHDGVEAFSAGRAGEAVQIYQRVIARRPDMAIAYRHLAFIEWQREARPRRSTSATGDARRRDDARVQAQLGGYLTDTGRLTDGLRLLEPLATRSEADPDTLNSLGIAYARAGRAEDARRVFERVLAASPDSSVPLENLGLLALERGDLGAAQQRFEQAVRVDPRSSRAHAGAGNVALRRGDRPAAIDAWTEAVRLDPANYDALYNLGVNLARVGRMDAARPYLERFLRSAPPAFYAQDLRDVARILQTR